LDIKDRVNKYLKYNAILFLSVLLIGYGCVKNRDLLIFNGTYNLENNNNMERKNIVKIIRAYIDVIELDQDLENKFEAQYGKQIVQVRVIKYPFVNNDRNCFSDTESCNIFTLQVRMYCVHNSCLREKGKIYMYTKKYISTQLNKIMEVSKTKISIEDDKIEHIRE